MDIFQITGKRGGLIFLFAFILMGTLLQETVHAQVQEPDVRGIDKPTSPLQKGYSNRIGGSAFVNNFGFGIGGTYGHALGPYTEFTFFTGITGIRDVSEQSFQNFFTGRKIVPDKYNRALGIPFLFGIKKRLFPKEIADNFRFFVAASGGPALAFLYPYVDDKNENGYRDLALAPNGATIALNEDKNDFFSGLGDGFTEWGAAGEIKVGVDLGSNFKRQSTLEIGYFFYYFDQGLQIKEPFQPASFEPCFQGQLACPVALDQDGNRVAAFDNQKFFGTPQIKFTFSGWW